MRRRWTRLSNNESRLATMLHLSFGVGCRGENTLDRQGMSPGKVKGERIEVVDGERCVALNRQTALSLDMSEGGLM